MGDSWDIAELLGEIAGWPISPPLSRSRRRSWRTAAGGSRSPARAATVGRLVPVPGGTNVIASRVDAWLDVRGDTDESTRALLAEITETMARRTNSFGCGLEVIEESYLAPVYFDGALRTRLLAALGDVPVLATGTTGVSHSPFETASYEDCRAGVEALTTVLAAPTAAALT